MILIISNSEKSFNQLTMFIKIVIPLLIKIKCLFDDCS